jgi:hypothetical protein
MADMSNLTDTIPTASTDKVERLMLAKQERLAVKAWRDAGSEGDAPATPNLDALNSDYESGVSTTVKNKKASKSANPRADKVEGIVFMYNGKPVAHNFLARLAANLKMPVVDFKALLAEQGVTAPQTTTWALMVGDAAVGAVLPGDDVPELLAVERTSRKARAPKVETVEEVAWSIRRVANRTYVASRDDAELGRFDSAKKALSEVVAAGGPEQVEVEDVRALQPV